MAFSTMPVVIKLMGTTRRPLPTMELQTAMAVLRGLLVMDSNINISDIPKGSPQEARRDSLADKEIFKSVENVGELQAIPEH